MLFRPIVGSDYYVLLCITMYYYVLLCDTVAPHSRKARSSSASIIMVRASRRLPRFTMLQFGRILCPLPHKHASLCFFVWQVQ